MKTLALLLMFVPTMALAQGHQGPPTKVLVWYDPVLNTIAETVIPDNDFEADDTFSDAKHPVMACNGPCVRLAIPQAVINNLGFVGAVQRLVPGLVATAEGQRSVAMLGNQVESMIIHNELKEVLLGA